MQHRDTHPADLQRLAARAARAVPGVAAVADPDVHIQLSQDGAAIDCTLTASPDVQLHELGAAVQIAIAAALRRRAGVEAREVNVSIIDIDERVIPRPSNPPGKNFDHG